MIKQRAAKIVREKVSTSVCSCFFAKIFGKDDAANPVKYRISLKPQGDKTVVSVLDAKGAPETSAAAQKIVGLLAEDLK